MEHLSWVILLFALLAAAEPFPDSPCPQYFRYLKDEGEAPRAVVSIPAHVRQLPITLRVHLALRVALKTKYVGMVVLAEHPTLVLGNLLAGKSNLVNYTIRFPLPHPVPILTKLTVNNATICVGEEVKINSVYGGVLTEIVLEHSFPAQEFLIRRRIGLGHETVYGNMVKDPAEGEKCGKTEFLYPEEIGESVEKWPWLAAIFIVDRNDFRFRCAGNLISTRHVVTAAHCIKNQINKKLGTRNFIVYLGLHNLEDFDDPKAQIKRVTDIHIHPEYNEDNYVADLAILEIDQTTSGENVRPVCLWNGGASLKPLIGHYGTVVGWGVDRETKRIEPVPEVFHLPIVDQAECLRSRKEFLYITSERTLCAGLRNGTGPCNGDSGSGLLILSYNNENSLAWHLRGVISLSLLDRKMETCDLNEYIVFTDVARFNNWINSIIYS